MHITHIHITHAHNLHAQGNTRNIPITPIVLQDRVMWPSHLISRFDGCGTFPCWTPRPPRAGGSGRGGVEGGTRWRRLCHLVLRREGERCLEEKTKWLRWPTLQGHLIRLSLQVTYKFMEDRQRCLFNANRNQTAVSWSLSVRRAPSIQVKNSCLKNFSSWRGFSSVFSRPTIATYVKAIPLAPGTIAMLVRTLRERSGWECKCEEDHRH